MLIYFILLFILLLFRNEKNKYVFWGVLCLMIMVSGFRAVTVGTDTIYYKETYEGINLIYRTFSSVLMGKEVLFFSFYYVSKLLDLPFQTTVFLSSILFLVPIGYVLYKINEKGVKSLLFLFLLGMYFFEFNGARQAIAMAFVFVGCYYLEKNNYLAFFVSILIGFGFHMTTIVALVLPLIAFIKMNRWMSLTILYLSYILPLFVDFMPLITSLSIMTDDFIGYAHYLDKTDVVNIGRLPVVGTVQTLLFTYIILCYEKFERNKDFFFKVSFICVIFHNLLYISPGYATRLLGYYEMAMIIFFVKWCKRSGVDAAIIYAYSFINFLYYYIILNTDQVSPYVFCFS